MQYIPFTKPLLPTSDEYQQKLEIIWKSHQLTNHGQASQELWKALAKQTEQKHFLLTSSGTLALIITIKALGLTGEIITSPFTFPAVPHAISFCGLTPVFCDTDKTTANIDPELIPSLITKKTSAILAVHTFGQPCNIERITTIAKKFGLKVIYDAAPAFAVSYKQKNVISYGDAAIHSYHATKIFHTVEGGAIFFRDKNALLRAKQLREFGFDEKKEKIKQIGINAKMSEFHATMGLCVLPLISKEIQERLRVYAHYNQELAAVKNISLPPKSQNGQAYTILIHTHKNKDLRNALYQYLFKNHIYTKPYYALLATAYPHYKNSKHSKLDNARLLAKEALSLPLYGKLTAKELFFITNTIKDFFYKNAKH